MKKLLLALSLLLTSCDTYANIHRNDTKVIEEVAEKFTFKFDEDIVFIDIIWSSKADYNKWFEENKFKYSNYEVYFVEVFGEETHCTYLATIEKGFDNVEVWNYDKQS